MARDLALHLRTLLALPLGYWWYRRTGNTPASAHQAFVWAFCATSGRFNDWISARIARGNGKVSFKGTKGVLGDMTADSLNGCTDALRRDGYVVFERALDTALCDRLLKFAMETPAKIRRPASVTGPASSAMVLFDPTRPGAVRFDYRPESLLNNVDVQSLLADHSILAVAQEYLGCPPVADVLSMWWHTSHSVDADPEAGQFFHFDMDRIKWLKVFIYLTDVEQENGPHMFIQGSHRSGAVPREVLRRGYVRLRDEELAEIYPPHRWVRFCAPRGTIILEDTRGLHKGAPVTGGPRLMLQFQFSNSLFGAAYPRARLGEVLDPGLRERARDFPAIFRQYV